MDIVVPILIDSSINLESHSASASIYPDYVHNKRGVVGDVVHFFGRNYQRIEPSIYKSPDDFPLFWRDLGAVSTLNAFDNAGGSAAMHPTEIRFTIKSFEQLTFIALLAVKALSASVTVTSDTGGVVYSKAVVLSDSGCGDWYEYFNEEYANKNMVFFDDLPFYPGAIIDVVLQSSTGVLLGNFIGGKSTYIGATNFGLGASIQDFSLKKTNDFGNMTFLERGFAKEISVVINVENSRLDFTFDFLAKNRAKPCLYIAAQSFSTFTAFGVYDDAYVLLPGPVRSVCNIEIQGLV